MSTGDEETPGNYGLKDQSLALKWVSENIHKFGGNPSKIIAMGGMFRIELRNPSKFTNSSRLFSLFSLIGSSVCSPADYVSVDKAFS
jgi:hypothetical protein